MNFVLMITLDTAQRFSNHIEFAYFAEKIVRTSTHAALPVLSIGIIGDHNNEGCRGFLFDVFEYIDSASSR
jgi:hypothetical protein